MPKILNLPDIARTQVLTESYEDHTTYAQRPIPSYSAQPSLSGTRFTPRPRIALEARPRRANGALKSPTVLPRRTIARSEARRENAKPSVVFEHVQHDHCSMVF